jgi:hypothetical protein
VTLLEAFDLHGGKGVAGAERTLLRAAVAALLNAAHPNVVYPLSESTVIADVDAALASNDRKGMFNLAKRLNSENNNHCPLT